MEWVRRKPNKGKYKHYSISNELRKENKSSDEFEFMLANLTLEEIVALKLEISTRPVNNRLYNIPIWKNMVSIVKEAVFRFAVSTTRTNKEAMSFLGLEEIKFYSLKRQFGLERLFKE